MAKASKMEQAQGKVTTIKRPESKFVEVTDRDVRNIGVFIHSTFLRIVKLLLTLDT